MMNLRIPSQRHHLTAVCLYVLFTNVFCHGQNVLPTSASGALSSSGILAYQVKEGGINRLYVLKCAGTNGCKFLFSKDIAGIQPPICGTNFIITVGASGVVTKFDLRGTSIFTSQLDDFLGASKMSCKWDDTTVIITETRFDKMAKRLLHSVLWVDVKGEKPIVIARTNTIQQVKLQRVFNELVVIGPKDIQRFRAPTNVVNARLEPDIE